VQHGWHGSNIAGGTLPTLPDAHCYLFVGAAIARRRRIAAFVDAAE
jgi:hypothetical protein